MANAASEVARPSVHGESMEFEHPLTERMRTFLRIELLYRQAMFHAENTTDLGARAAVARLLEIMTILGRGDVRADVLKELERHRDLLSSYARQPEVDQSRLRLLIDDVQERLAALADSGPKFMSSLKECEFLNSIKHRSSIPGGTCTFDLPDYAYWLRLPGEERARQFDAWSEVLRPMCDAVSQVLWLTRETNEPTEEIAHGGLYQQNMDRQEPPRLLRVLLPPGAGIYPEISAGKHRFTVRFVVWKGVDARPAQVDRDVRFQLVLC